MDIEISIAIIAFAFVLLVIFAVQALVACKNTMKKAEKAIENINKLTIDLNHKAEALNVVFHPLQFFKKEKKGPSGEIVEIIECVTDAISLFQRVKEKVKDYV